MDHESKEATIVEAASAENQIDEQVDSEKPDFQQGEQSKTEVVKQEEDEIEGFTINSAPEAETQDHIPGKDEGVEALLGLAAISTTYYEGPQSQEQELEENQEFDEFELEEDEDEEDFPVKRKTKKGKQNNRKRKQTYYETASDDEFIDEESMSDLEIADEEEDEYHPFADRGNSKKKEKEILYKRKDKKKKKPSIPVRKPTNIPNTRRKGYVDDYTPESNRLVAQQIPASSVYPSKTQRNSKPVNSSATAHTETKSLPPQATNVTKPNISHLTGVTTKKFNLATFDPSTYIPNFPVILDGSTPGLSRYPEVPPFAQQTWRRCAAHIAVAYYIYYDKKLDVMKAMTPNTFNMNTVDPTWEARRLKESTQQSAQKQLPIKQPNNPKELQIQQQPTSNSKQNQYYDQSSAKNLKISYTNGSVHPHQSNQPMQQQMRSTQNQILNQQKQYSAPPMSAKPTLPPSSQIHDLTRPSMYSYQMPSLPYDPVKNIAQQPQPQPNKLPSSTTTGLPLPNVNHTLPPSWSPKPPGQPMNGTSPKPIHSQSYSQQQQQQGYHSTVPYGYPNQQVTAHYQVPPIYSAGGPAPTAIYHPYPPIASQMPNHGTSASSMVLPSHATPASILHFQVPPPSNGTLHVSQQSFPKPPPIDLTLRPLKDNPPIQNGTTKPVSL